MPALLREVIPTRWIETPMPAAKDGGAWLYSFPRSVPIRNEKGVIEFYERRQVWTFHKNGGDSILRF
jgi:hypothetical protein